MDELAGLLAGPRARDVFALKVLMTAPWSVEIRDEAPLSVTVLTEGEAVLEVSDHETITLRPGDLALLRGPAPYRLAHEEGRAPDVLILPGQVCCLPDGESASERMDLGLNTWGNDPAGETAMVVGTYQGDGEIGRRLLEQLPPVVILPSDSWATPLISLLTEELSTSQPGHSAMLDRLVDLLVISAVREWARGLTEEAPGAVGMTSDVCVRDALRLIHDHCDQPWSVESLAQTVGLSRAAFARRFHAVVGQAPIAYLTQWRLTLAADLLRAGELGVAVVAARVGYPNPFTFSTAFKRHYGRSPRQYAAPAPDSGPMAGSGR